MVIQRMADWSRYTERWRPLGDKEVHTKGQVIKETELTECGLWGWTGSDGR